MELRPLPDWANDLNATLLLMRDNPKFRLRWSMWGWGVESGYVTPGYDQPTEFYDERASRACCYAFLAYDDAERERAARVSE